MTNSSIIDRASKVLMNTYGRLPIALVRGEGCWVWDAEGKKYLDLVGGIAVNCLGHCHPQWLKVLAEQASQLTHVSNLYHILPQIELAEVLTNISFADRVFFCNSGAEANEAAVKLTRKYFKSIGLPERYQVICMENSFHGRTLAMISATGQAKVKKGFEPMVEGFSHVPFGDLAALEKAIGPKTAAILLELVQGEGGVQFASEDYLRGVRELCDRKKILLIYDEVQTGVGRTGKFFAYEHSKIAPDLLTLAKGLAGGLPIGALLATEKIAEVFQPGDHAATFGGNPLVTRVAREVISILREGGILKNCEEVGNYFLMQLGELQKKHPQIISVRGRGLMIGVELQSPGKELVLRGLEKGLLLNCTQEKVLRFVPPLILSREEVDFAINILDELL
jgi:acetylornithine/N-succinyldiaminopimelate aminotransferase